MRLFSEGLYGAQSWEHERRVAYKAEAMEKGTNTRFVVTTRTDDPKELYAFYARRGESENWIKDLKGRSKPIGFELPSVHGKPVSPFVARGGLLAYGCFAQEAGWGWAQTDATGHPKANSHQDRREGKRALHQDPAVSGLRTSGAKFMARSLESLRRRS